MLTDRYGLQVSTRSDAAATLYRCGVDLVLSAWPGAAAALDASITADPDFALAHLARARIHQMHSEIPAALAAAKRARTLVVTASSREQSHVHAIASAIEGQASSAITAAEAHLEAWPRDALVLSMLLGAFGLYAFSGRADHDAARVAICERHARHYGADWWFLTYLGWSHTEAGNPGAGRALTQQALDLRSANANAAHALSHALFELGEHDASQAFIDGWLPNYDRAGILNGHLCWHLSLLALERGDAASALKLYEERIRPAVSHAAPLNAFTDSASLLWRASLMSDAPLQEQWRETAAYATQMFPKPGLAFADVHHALTAGATGDVSQSRVLKLAAMQTDGQLAAGAVVVHLSRGLEAFAGGDYTAAITLLEPALADAVRIGGSHAQRELLEDTLIVAWLRAGHFQSAQVLIDRRLHRRPSARDAIWRAQTTAA
jgi:hypothetical protein